MTASSWSSSRKVGLKGLFRRLARRSLTVPGLFLGSALFFLLLPLTISLAAAFDLSARKPSAYVRTLLFVALYLCCEMVGVLVATLLWLTSGLWLLPASQSLRRRFERQNFWLQCRWGDTLARGGRRIFSLDLKSQGDECLNREAPVLLLLRHSSMLDTVLAIHTVSVPYGLELRYVLKEQLLISPCLDIVGHRLRNWFVRRGVGSRFDIEAVAALCEDLAPRQGVLIYPEGTRFTEEKRQRTLDRLERLRDETNLARAQALEHVLPLRTAGPVALLAHNHRQPRPADVVFCTHTGFEGSASLGQILHGALVGKTIRLRFWRISSDLVPTSEQGIVDWLHEQWLEVDRFVGDSFGESSRQPARDDGSTVLEHS